MSKPMLSDCHIHTIAFNPDPKHFSEQLKIAGVEEAVILSNAPMGFSKSFPDSPDAERLKAVMAFCANEPTWHPFYWLNPMAENAAEQIQSAVAAGVEGFKIICSEYYPSHEKAMAAFRFIAQLNKPILFHTGILWDGKPSGKYTNPIEYECLLDVPKLRFAIAHVSWPWTDTAIAMFGKFLNAYSSGDATCEMFIDTTPGTPEIYRQDVLTKLYTIGYDIADNLIFGTDGNTTNYNIEWVQKWSQMDKQILEQLGINDETIARYQKNNLRRFLYGGKKEFRLPGMGE